MGLRHEILNINFRGARKTLSKTPRGRFLTPRRVARVPTTPAATNHVKTCNTYGVLPVTELTYLQVAKRGTHAVALRHDGAKKHSTRKPKKTIAQTRREAVAPKPAALRAKYAETLELARPDVHDVFRKEVAAGGDGATVVEFFVNTPTAGGADKVVVLRARADATVKAVKAQLAAKSGLAAGALALSWGGKPLWRDGCTIGDYGLRAGATLVATGRVRGGMPTASELRDAFAKFDVNGDGVLSFDELVGVFTRPVDAGEPMTEEQARAYVAKHDKNGDGKLDLDEFAAALAAEQAEREGAAGGDPAAGDGPTDAQILDAVDAGALDNVPDPTESIEVGGMLG